MKLLSFQRAAVDSVIAYSDLLKKIDTAGIGNFSTSKTIDYPSMAWLMSQTDNPRSKAYCPIKTSSGKSIPNLAICVPTGGGKTVIGIATATELLYKHSIKENNFILWLAPSDAIYSQVIKEFGREGKYFKFIKDNYGKDINLKLSKDTWTDEDLTDERVTVLLLTYQSIIRKNDKQELQIYRNPDKVGNLSIFLDEKENPSLYGVIKKIKPIVVIDESHRYYTSIGRGFFKKDELASFIIELTATPKQYSNDDYPNIVFAANGKMLIEEELIKTPIVYHALQDTSLEDLIARVLDHQNNLERNHIAVGSKIMPKVLISTEFTGKEMADQPYSAQSIKRILIEKGVPAETISMKSSELDELGDRDIDGPGEKTRFILTKRALMEGWDCKSVFTVVMVNKIGAEVTNFQLIGRGLRQPNKRYEKIPELNELNVFTNSTSHDHAVIKLKNFLDDSGLADTANDIFITSDNRTSKEYFLQENILFNFIKVKNQDLLNDGLIKLSYLNFIKNDFSSIVVDTKELQEPEEFSQKIDVSKDKIFGVVQGKTHFSNSLKLSNVRARYKLTQTLYSQLKKIIPRSSALYQLINIQLNKFEDLPHVYNCRVDLVNKLSKNIYESQLDYAQKYFVDFIANNLELKTVELSQFIPDKFLINAVPDLGLETPFRNNILGNIPKSLFNLEELDFARFLDQFANCFWLRSIPTMKLSFPYAYGNFHPDFVIFLMDKDNKLVNKTIFVETKGTHLIGSQDSNAKAYASELITKISTDSLEIIFGSFTSCKERVRGQFDASVLSG